MFQLYFAIYAWVGFWGIAAWLFTTRRWNIPLLLGLVVAGATSFIRFLGWWSILNPFAVFERNDLLWAIFWFAMLPLVLGVIMLALRGAFSGGGKAMSASSDDKGLNLATLFTPRNTTNTFSRGKLLLDEASALLVARAKADNLEFIEQRSQLHSPSLWFRIDYQLPSPNPEVSLCASVAVAVERYDFHRFEHVFDITVQVGAKLTRIKGVTPFDDNVANLIHQHILTPGHKLRIPGRVRRWPFQLWRPKNKVQRLKKDWVALGLTAAIVLSPTVLAAIIGPLFAFAIFGAGIVILVIRAQKRRLYVLTSGKPLHDPRRLRWMDSWQASIGGLGAQSLAVRDGIIARLRSGGPDGANVATERIGYWGTDSWVEREQIVVAQRRALGYIHVVAYGDVLYVAWECHLNTAAWIEQRLASGIDQVTGLDVVANRVVAGTHQLNEYDVSDSNFLAEWMHEAVKREVKLRMAEQQIDQEIDFTVQRESRKAVLGARGDESGDQRRSVADRFKRVA